jgi:hypothetical protein
MKLNTSQRLKLKQPIEVWENKDAGWKWEVYKKYQKPENEVKNPYARWFCKVYSQFVPEGEFGDVYINEIKGNSKLKQ